MQESLDTMTRKYQTLYYGGEEGSMRLSVCWHPRQLKTWCVTEDFFQLLLKSREELPFIWREVGLGPNPSASLSSKVRIIIVLTGNSVSQEYSEDYVASALCCEMLSAKYDYTGISIQRSQSTFQTLIIEAL